MKLSVVLAVKNEQENISRCISSVERIADEIIVVDDGSNDETVKIAKKLGARVYSFIHKNNFHETKQFAIEKAKGEWVLQLDADEIVTKDLADEIKRIIDFDNDEIINYQQKLRIENPKEFSLFMRHQSLISQREGHLGKSTGEIVAFFIPRTNFFLGGRLIYAGVYPDGVIRLFKNGKARLPAKSVHELMEVAGEVGWLFNFLEHHESPTLKRYLDRANRYTDYSASMFGQKKVPVNVWQLLLYSTAIPLIKFVILYLRHKGFMDGMRGFLWSLFSALHFPISYFKYWQRKVD